MEILEKVKSSLPKEVVDRIELEGCEIVVYTKDKFFFLDASEQVKSIVQELKKRIEVRPDSTLSLSPEDAKKIIMEIVPEEAKVKDIRFEPERSLVIITAEKPGLVIGRGGETFKEIKEKTLWVPRIERVPEITSRIVRSIRDLLYKETKWRKTFLKKVGKNIFTERETKRDWVRIVCLGGWREVGRSCNLVETPKSKILIECGVNVGGDESSRFPYLQVKEFDPSELDGIIVSHPHLDHCGMVPYLYEYGYDGPFYCTTPCLDLFTMLCLDYIDVLQRNGVQPPFTAKGVKEAVKHSITLEYDEVSDVGPDTRLTFQQAGHLLGSAQIHLHVGQGLHNIVFTGDIKFGKTRLFDPAFTNFQRIETLIIESTYGGSEDVMPRREESEQFLLDTINRTMERGGQVLIPSFAVGRGQEVMAILSENKFEYPVFIDGMIWDATAVHTAYPEYMSMDMERKIFQGNNPFMNEIFKRVTSSQEREKVWNEKPSVIISTSGMLTGGPAMEHLKALGENKNNTLIFVGYQGEGTMGRRIQKGWREIPFTVEGKTQIMKLKLEVQTIEGLSGHCDVNQLINFVHRLKSKPERILVCHGDNTRPINLARSLHKLFRIETMAPKNLEAVRLR
ncbi:MAG: beta-CASP ribonuclease aCPSF1 [Candidatus Aenigmarchaeota archaeon]|nr:beta-CASP ribonuclease aCPSF1 [Candidatus Aenigmarchaeota archaeon]